MLTMNFIGNLGLDCEVSNNLLRLRVAVGTRRKVGGESVLDTVWVTCWAPVDKLKGVMPFLKKGCTVYVSGRPNFSTYSSPVAKAFVVDISVWIDVLEICRFVHSESV